VEAGLMKQFFANKKLDWWKILAMERNREIMTKLTPKRT